MAWKVILRCKNEEVGLSMNECYPNIEHLIDVKVKIVDFDFLKSVPYEKVTNYLRKYGWVIAMPFVYEEREVGHLWKNGDIQFSLPSNGEFGDYPSRLYDALASIERLTNKSQLRIVTEILGS